MFFSPGRIIPYWNKLPTEVKNCLTVLSFKTQLEGFKKDMISKCIINDFNFWNVSNEVLTRIEGTSYVRDKEKHNERHLGAVVGSKNTVKYCSKIMHMLIPALLGHPVNQHKRNILELPVRCGRLGIINPCQDNIP